LKASNGDQDGLGLSSQYVLIEHLHSLLKSKGTKIQYTVDKENAPAENKKEDNKKNSFTSKDESNAKIAVDKTLEFIRILQERIEELMTSSTARIMSKFTAFVKDAKDYVYNLLENDFIKGNFSKDKK